MARSRTRSPVTRRKPAPRRRSDTPSPPRRNRSKQSPKRSDRRNSKDKSKIGGGRVSKSPPRPRPRSSSRDARPTASRLRSSPSKDVRPALASRLGKKERSLSKERRTTTTSRKRSESPKFVAKPRRPKRSESPELIASKPPKKYPNIKVTTSASGDADMDVRIEGEVENLPIFRGPELDLASVKELKKIQIEIRRNLPEKSGRSRSPIRRNISDPEKLFVPRKPDEGRSGIFEREEIKYYFPDGEKKVSLIDRVLKKPETKTVERKIVESQSRSRSPRDRDTRDRKRTVRDDDRDLRDRLGKTTSSSVFNRDRLEPRNASGRSKERLEDKPSIKSRLDQPSVKGRLENKPSMKDRLGDRTNNDSTRDRIKPDFRDRNKPDFRNRAQSGNRDGDDPDRVLSREELERERPQVKPWEINPEFVPKGRYYFEHDNREGAAASNFEGRGGRDGFSGSSRGFQTRGRGNFQSRDREDNFRGRGGRRPFKRSFDSRGSPEWQHDKFAEEVERYEEPTSTTNE